MSVVFEEESYVEAAIHHFIYPIQQWRLIRMSQEFFFLYPHGVVSRCDYILVFELFCARGSWAWGVLYKYNPRFLYRTCAPRVLRTIIVQLQKYTILFVMNVVSRERTPLKGYLLGQT